MTRPLTIPDSLGLTCHDLDGSHHLYSGTLPEHLVPDEEAFQRLWQLHPDEYHEIKMHGKLVKTPRWQQAYGADYHYTGRVNKALPVPAELSPILSWCQ